MVSENLYRPDLVHLSCVVLRQVAFAQGLPLSACPLKEAPEGVFLGVKPLALQ